MRNRNVQKALRKAGIPTEKQLAEDARRIKEDRIDWKNMCGEFDPTPREAVERIIEEELHAFEQKRAEREAAVRRITREVKYGRPGQRAETA